MRRAAGIAMAGCLALTTTLAQSCLAPGAGVTPYPSYASNQVSTSAPSNGAGGANFSNSYEDPHPDTTGYTADQKGSAALSDYLRHRRLPLVGAQMLKGPAGQRVVILYGFVGSDFGKQDAVGKARAYLADTTVPVDNRIKVNPELLAAGGASGGAASDHTEAEPSPDTQYPGVNSYQQQQNQASQYAQQQTTGSAISSVAPLLMLGLMALSVASGGAFAVGPGSTGFGGPGGFGGGLGGSPFGPAPYNPYPGFPSPSTPAPYGGAVNPFGGAGSPYTVAPVSPYGP